MTDSDFETRNFWIGECGGWDAPQESGLWKPEHPPADSQAGVKAWSPMGPAVRLAPPALGREPPGEPRVGRGRRAGARQA